MSKYAIDEATLRGIADAIRSRTGKSDPISASEMAAEIATVSAIPQEAFSITGSCERRFASDGFTWFIKHYGSLVTTSDITSCKSMFDGCVSPDLKEIPFEINCKSGSNISVESMFNSCWYLEHIPKITGCRPINTINMFARCTRLKELPADIDDWFDWSYIESNVSGYRTGMFVECNSLRKIPKSFLDHNCADVQYNSTYLYNCFRGCKSLDELTELPIPFTGKFLTSTFQSTSFENCGRLKNLTFALDPDTNAPYVKEWSGQTLSLDVIGVTSNSSDFLSSQNTSGITSDTRVTDAVTYAGLKNNPDWWTTDAAYSRYNHDSAVATINSLPDTSAFLAGNISRLPNTIKFKGAAGSKTDGGAINTMTEAEIAVATAKGWTVSFV